MISECEETPAVPANKNGEKKNNDVEREEREVEEIAAILHKLF